MAKSFTFDDIMAPLGAERFLKEYLGKQPLHLEGGADKFKDLMSFEILGQLLSMTPIWSHQSMLLILDKEPVPAASFCTAAPGRDGGQVLRPDPAKVKRYIAQGATLVANDIDQLTPELRAFSGAMEEALGGKVQANLYLSSKRKQGFQAHFDTHDVFAVHVEGEKVWHVFEGRAEDPIAHRMFKELPQEHHEKAKGELWKEVRLKPGDILYLPRGQYHYALADDGGCIHLAMGVTYPIGIDVVSYLFDRMVAEPLCRRNLPQGDPAALAEHLNALGRRMAEVLAEPKTLADIEAFQRGYRYPRDDYDIDALLDPGATRYEVRAKGVRLIEQGGRHGLADEATRKAVAIPPEVVALTRWVLARKAFSRAEIDAAFPAEPSARIDKFLDDMQGMALVAPAI